MFITVITVIMVLTSQMYANSHGYIKSYSTSLIIWDMQTQQIVYIISVQCLYINYISIVEKLKNNVYESTLLLLVL